MRIPAIQILILLSLVLRTQAADKAENQAAPVGETRELSAPEAIQAAAVQGEFVYAIASEKIAKYDRTSGRRVALSNGSATHLNSGFIWKGQLLCAHSNFPGKHRNEAKSRS